MDTSTALTQLKKQAEINALKKLQGQFSTADQLEQIDQHIHRSEKRKNMIESQLKSAIQSHFFSVNSCMDQLKDVNKNVQDIKTTIYSIEGEYKNISHLENTLQELRSEAYKHKQLKSAKENVKNILNISHDDMTRKALDCIENNQLLAAHKLLLDMEKCRNDILEELGTPSSSNLSDIELVEKFFKGVTDLHKELQNQNNLTITRMLEVAKVHPEKLVTALRIIEREEILDDYWKKKKDETGFAPTDRPKNCKLNCQKTLRKLVDNKIQGCRVEERETDESWFSKHLGNICSRLLYDLEVVKKLCEPCFPPSYKIFDFYISCVHETLSSYLKQLVDTEQLKGQEYFILLYWQNTYKSEDLMGSPKLHIDTSKLPELLEDGSYRLVLIRYIDYATTRLSSFFEKVLDKNVKEWYVTDEDKQNTTYTQGLLESSLSNDINSIVVQQLTYVNYAKDDRFSKTFLKLLTDQLNILIDKLKERLSEFKMNHFRDVEVLKEKFTNRMIATSNDSFILREYFLNIRKNHDRFIDSDEIGGPNDQYELLANKVESVSDLCLDFIIEDMYKCLDEKYFRILLTKEWLTNEGIIKTIIDTSADYFIQDLTSLRKESRFRVLYKWHLRIKVEYMKGFLQNMSSMFKKMQYSDAAERDKVTSKMAKEIHMLEQWFQNMCSGLGDKTKIDFMALACMNKILKADDVDFLAVDIGSLVKKCPGITSDMLYALISLRGDISKADYKEKYEDYLNTETDKTKATSGRGAAPVVKQDEAMILLKKELKIIQ